MSMNIVVCVKQVPDTAVERTLKPGAGTLDRESPDGLINELDEYAIEEGLKIAEAHGGEVTILTVGPAKAAESIRKALSMGADKAIHICDEALAGSDALATSLVLAEALKQGGQYGVTRLYRGDPPAPESVWLRGENWCLAYG